MKKKPLLTIGIPAYNVELFIKDTVLSIAKSKYKNKLEILVVNDGSSDKTSDIVHQLTKQYSCLKIVDKPNGGHGSSINAAIAHASGKYFRLLDGDDWFDTAEFDQYIQKLENETADIVFTDLVECFIKSNLNRPVTYYSHLPEYQTFNLDDVSFPDWGPMLPTTTIKTDLLKKFGLKIDEKCFYVDQEYNLACYLSAKTAVYYPFMIYQYRLEREGQSMQKESLIKNVSSHEKVCKRLLSEYSKHKTTMSECRKEYLSNKVIIPMCHMQNMIAIEWCKSRKDFLSFDKTLKKYPEFYNNPGIAGNLTKFHRKTNGLFIKVDPVIRKIAVQKSRSKKTWKTRLLKLLGCLIPLILANLLLINYVNSEQTIHFWDTSAYWKNSIDLVDTFNTDKLEGFNTVIRSLSTDYNLLPILPMVPFLSIFGTSRLSFILIVLNLYVLPFALIMTKTVVAAYNNKNRKLKTWVYPLVFSIFLLSPCILIPVVNGRPDAICLIFISLIFYLFVKTKMNYISNYFILAALVFPLIVLRRYFSFLAITLYLSIFILKTLINIRKYGFSKITLTKTIKLAIKLLVSGFLVILLMFIFSKSLLFRYLTGGYTDIYSAYKISGFIKQIILFIKYYGIIFLGLSMSGIFIVFYKHFKASVKETIGIGLVCSLLTFVLFNQVQTLGDQHMYLFVPFLTFSIALFLVYLSNFKHPVVSLLPTLIIIILSIFTFVGPKIESPSSLYNVDKCSKTCYLFGLPYYPRIRNDLDEINKLDNYLEDKMTSTDYVYTLSSSDIFNDDLLRNLKLPKKPNYNISNAMHVDKRDGFPFYFFDATYILVADPIQTHLTEDGQDVIKYLSEQILNKNAGNLKQINSFSLDQNVKLKLFYKESAYKKEFIEQIKQYFKEKYPSYPFLYENIVVD